MSSAWFISWLLCFWFLISVLWYLDIFILLIIPCMTWIIFNWFEFLYLDVIRDFFLFIFIEVEYRISCLWMRIDFIYRRCERFDFFMKFKSCLLIENPKFTCKSATKAKSMYKKLSFFFKSKINSAIFDFKRIININSVVYKLNEKNAFYSQLIKFLSFFLTVFLCVA